VTHTVDNVSLNKPRMNQLRYRLKTVNISDDIKAVWKVK